MMESSTYRATLAEGMKKALLMQGLVVWAQADALVSPVLNDSCSVIKATTALANASSGQPPDRSQSFPPQIFYFTSPRAATIMALTISWVLSPS